MLGKNNCTGFFTEEIRENGERVGFKINTLSGKTGILAHVNIESNYKISRYGVDLETFEKLCLKELKNAINNNKEYIIIDEIGPMQLFSDEYKKLLYQLLNTSKKIIGTIFYQEHEWLDQFKKEENVHLVDITLENRDILPLQIIEEVSKDNQNLMRKINKAQRYITEKNRFENEKNKTIINSEHGTRTINWNKNECHCDCEFFQENNTCSHIISAITLFGIPENN